MATIIAAAGGGNWTTGGTWVGGVAPTAADDAQLIATSGNVTIDSGAVCRSIDLTGGGLSNYIGTLTHTAAVTLTIGDATAGASNIALAFPTSGWTYTLGNATTSAISFVSSSATVQTINFGGKTTGNVTFNASSNGSWQYTGAHTSGGTITLTKGTLDVNGQTCSWSIFSSDNTNTRSMSLGAASITVTSSTGWSTRPNTNMTFNAGTSTLTFNAPNSGILVQGGDMTFYNTTFTGNQNPSIQNTLGANTLTFNNLTRTGSNNKTNAFTISGNLTINGTLTLTGNSITNRLFFVSSSQGTSRTITAAAVSLTNTDFRDITGAGAASSFTGTSLGNAGNNSGITTDTPVTRYWVATSGGNWSAASSWAASSGGASGSTVPLVHDTIVFDTNSITSTGRTITADMTRMPALDFSNILNAPTLAVSVTVGGVGQELYGGLVLKSGMTTSGTNAFGLLSRSDYSITTNGTSISFPATISTLTTITTTLTDNFTSTSALALSSGTLTVSGAVNVPSFTSTNTNNATRVINMGTDTWTLTSSGTIWNIANSNITVNPSTSKIIVTDTSVTDKTFAGGGKTYNNFKIMASGSGKVIFTGANTFNIFEIYAPKTVQFPNTTTTIITTLIATGSSGNVITISSTTGGTVTTLNNPGPNNWYCDWLSLQDITGTGVGKFAGANSTNVSGNTGWIFSPTLGTPEIPQEQGMRQGVKIWP
jgi:hypothetical protein